MVFMCTSNQAKLTISRIENDAYTPKRLKECLAFTKSKEEPQAREDNEYQTRRK